MTVATKPSAALRRLAPTLFLIAASCAPPEPDGDLSIITNSPLDTRGPDSRCAARLCTSLRELIRGAESSVDFAIYGLRGQPDILAELVEAQRRGVRIRGVVDKNIKGRHYYRDTPALYKKLRHIRDDWGADQRSQAQAKQAKYRDRCRRPRGHKGPLQCFEGGSYASKEPLPARGAIMHHKFFVMDNRVVWTGSANISDTGIGGYNANVALVIRSPAIARRYTREFANMYVHNKFHGEKPRASPDNRQPEIRVDGAPLDVLFSPQDDPMNSKLIKLVEAARETVDVAMFFLTHNDMSRALAGAATRGVKVRVILDATGAANEYSKHKYLRDNGVHLKVESWGGKMHAKAALIDGAQLVIGSMNWTKAGNRWNDENTIIIQSPNHAQQFQTFYNLLWTSIPDRWLSGDPKPESPDSGTSCQDGMDNDWDTYVDNKDWDCKPPRNRATVKSGRPATPRPRHGR